MRAASHFVLDDDIVDRLLRFSQDFAALRAFALSCRTVYDVYRAHPKSITRAVAYGVVGPVLPQALQLIRNQCSDAPSSEDSIHVPPVDTTTVIARHELDALEQNQDVVRQLEDMFSQRYRGLIHVMCISTLCDARRKDRSSATSVLSDVESLRFRRAMYHFWLFQSVFPYNEDTLDDEDDLTVEDAIEQVRERRRQFLQNHSTQDLHEMNSIALFLADVYTWTGDAENLHPGSSYGR